MPLFSYVCRNEDGKEVNGVLNADSAMAAREALREMELDIIELSSIADVKKSAADDPPKQAPQKTPGDRKKKEVPVAVSFAPPPPLPTPPPASSQEPKPTAPQQMLRSYHPLSDTIALYAGWLLAWYIVVFALGGYQRTRDIPFSIPYVDELMQSTLVLKIAFGCFLYLLLLKIHAVLGRGTITAIVLALIGLSGLGWFIMNV